jgi:cytochrome c oxidase cbb3-type subunit 2
VSCHSQQVGSKEFNSDIARGWGSRRSVAQDYLYDRPALLGSQRVGPDLSNIGARSPGADWLLLHLYDPRAVLPKGAKSVMPPYRFLFKTRKVEGQPSSDALKLTGDLAPPANFEVVPTAKARELVAYLTSLRSDAILFETPAPKPPTGSAATNAPASVTNSPAK